MSFLDALAVFALALLVAGLTSQWAARSPTSPVAIAFALGLIFGPYAASVIHLSYSTAQVVLHDVAQVTLAFTVMEIALRVGRPRHLRANLSRWARLVFIGMPGMWLIASVGAWLFLNIPFPAALAIGAALSPTDPVIGSTLTTGPMAQRLLPERLRVSLQLESGTNDGLALPFILFSVALAEQPVGAAIRTWAAETVREVGLAIVIGLALGAAMGWISYHAHRFSTIGETYGPLLGIATGLAALSVSLIAGGSGVLATFCAGIGLSLTMPDELRESFRTAQETAAHVAVVTLFVLFGSGVSFDDWVQLGWGGVALALWALALRRPAVVPLALLGTDTGPRSTALLAWFAPMGAGSIYYITYLQQYHLREYPTIVAATSITVAVSIVAYSATATASARLYAKHAGTATEDGPNRVAGPLP